MSNNIVITSASIQIIIWLLVATVIGVILWQTLEISIGKPLEDIRIMDCYELKEFVLNHASRDFLRVEAEHRYEWMCEK